jgi:hypothetical protein
MTMCGRHEHYAGRRWRRHWGRFGDREEWLSRLKEYQRDLEQELADVADIVRRLDEESPGEAPAQTASV